MKTILRLLFLLLCANCTEAQITSAVTRAGFGIDADLRANFFNGIQQSGTDDWFSAPGSFGAGTWVIDTTGAAALVARYATDINFLKITFLSYHADGTLFRRQSKTMDRCSIHPRLSW